MGKNFERENPREPDKIHYSVEDVDFILEAYKYIFRGIDKKTDLLEFFDIFNQRKKTWSFLTSNFLVNEYSDYKTFHDNFYNKWDSLDKFIENGKNQLDSYEIISKKIKFLGGSKIVGTSIGLNPKTDDLLLRTFKNGKKDIIIIMAHDYHPIVTKDQNEKINDPFENSPLVGCSMFENSASQYEKYGKLFEKCNIEEIPIILYFNLYPFYREPNSSATGKFNLECSYEECVNSYIKLFQLILENGFYIKGIITWGTYPAFSFKKEEKINLKNSSQNIDKKEFNRLRDFICKMKENDHNQFEIEVDNNKIPFYPLYHPAARESEYKKSSKDIFEKILG